MTEHWLMQLFSERLKFDSSLDRNALCNPEFANSEPEISESDIFALGIRLEVARPAGP
jgi:hypothetical protein